MPKSTPNSNYVSSQDTTPGSILYRSASETNAIPECYAIIGQNDDSFAIARMFTEAGITTILKSKTYRLAAAIENNLTPSVLTPPLYIDCSRLMIRKKDNKEAASKTFMLVGRLTRMDLNEVEKRIMVATTISLNMKSNFLPHYF